MSASSSNSNDNGTPTPVPRGAMADGMRTSVSDVTVTLDGGNGPPALDIGAGAVEKAASTHQTQGVSVDQQHHMGLGAVTPPPPSPQPRTGVKAVGQGPADERGTSPAAGSFVES